jgi:SNF2 family DNA or RNA helicase
MQNRIAQPVDLTNLKISRSKRDGFSKNRYDKVDTSYPGIISDSQVIDGRHRAAKLLDQGEKQILMHSATPADMAQVKLAALKPDIQPREHQLEAAEVADQKDGVLFYHGLGTGKSLSSLLTAENAGKPTLTFAPAALRGNYKKEIEKFTDGTTPYDIKSYNAASTGDFQPQPTLIADEVQRLRNQGKAYHGVMGAAQNANKRILLSGTPLVNRPGDLASIVNLLHGKQMYDPNEFEDEFSDVKVTKPLFGIFGKEKVEPLVKNEEKLKSLLAGRVHYVGDKLGPTDTKPNTKVRELPIPMSQTQTNLIRLMEGNIPSWAKWMIRRNLPPSRQQSPQLNAFLSGMRQVSLTPYGFDKRMNPIQAFDNSTKLQAAFNHMKRETSRPDGKVMVYSNFIQSGLEPYSAALQRANIPHVVFTGGMSDKQRKEAVDAYNGGRVKVVLIGPAGSEGISLRGTSRVQILDPHWNNARIQQAQGRAVRLDSHIHLPLEDRNVKIDRYIAEPQRGFFGKLMGSKPTISADRYLYTRSKEKEAQIEQFVRILKEVGTKHRELSVVDPLARQKSEEAAVG